MDNIPFTAIFIVVTLILIGFYVRGQIKKAYQEAERIYKESPDD